MAKGVFLHRADSIYDDEPHERYQFPAAYLGRASQCVGDWIVYLEPTKAGKSGYHALAKIDRIVADPTTSGMYVALIEQGSYLPFEKNVPFKGLDGYPERSVANDLGKPSGRAQAAMRVIPEEDFNRIVMLGIPDEDDLLPREGTYSVEPKSQIVAEVHRPFFHEADRPRSAYFNQRIVRDRVFRSRVLDAYEGTCAFTGLKFVNGGGRVEAEAAHIIPVEHNGPDIVGNGIALSGTVHWMFDRGLLSLTDNFEILVSSGINDQDGLAKLLLPNRRANVPNNRAFRPHPRYLEWHRSRFKA